MAKTNIKLYINNNPKCHGILENQFKKETWNMDNVPFIIVSGENIEDGSKKISLEVNGQKIDERVIEINENQFEIKIELDEPINNPQNAKITLEEEIYNIPILLKKLHGTVKYYDGTPIKEPIINVTGRSVTALGNDDGEFEIVLCGKESQMGIFEKEYSKETLESWLYNIDLQKDERLDIKIGTLEVFGIHMWEGLMGDFLHFTPMSLVRAKKAAEAGVLNDLELLEHEGLWPTLEKMDARIFANEEEVEILTFNEVEEYLIKVNGKTYTRPSYVVSIPKGYGHQTIKIEIQHRIEEEAGLILERGQGYYFWR